MTKSEALKIAGEKGLDLVEVAPKANPPVAKIIDFKKFKYLENKKQRESKKGAKVELKEVRLTPFIAKGDLDTRLEKIREFLGDGHRVKIVVRFAGRQITRKEFGYQLIEKVVNQLEEFAKPDGKPKERGRQIYLVLNAIKGQKK